MLHGQGAASELLAHILVERHGVQCLADSLNRSLAQRRVLALGQVLRRGHDLAHHSTLGIALRTAAL